MVNLSEATGQEPKSVFWRYRLQFSKAGLACYISHQDLVRTFTRAIRRARLPVALTQGFNPYPDLSFGPPLPLGIAGEKEYLDLTLVRALRPANICQSLSEVLPEGLRVKKAWLRSKNGPSLMAAVCRATYQVKLALTEKIEAEELIDYIQAFLATDEIVITRIFKNKEKKQDIRPGIFSLKGQVKAGEMLLEMDLKLGSQGNVRPDQVLQVFLADFPFQINPDIVKIVRTELGPVELLIP